MKRWLIKHWNLITRGFRAWRQRQYERAIEFYAIERSLWVLRGKRRPASSTRIGKPSRQLARAIGRRFRKLNEQIDKDSKRSSAAHRLRSDKGKRLRTNEAPPVRADDGAG